MTEWIWRRFSEFTPQELYDLLSVRQEVFALEQKCLYQDLDYRDQNALHLIGKNKNKIVAYIRYFPKGTLFNDSISFGRVLTAQSERGKGLAKEAMKQLMHYVNKHENGHPIVISAQLYLTKFYSEFGFHPVGQPYDEDGIPHIKMKKD